MSLESRIEARGRRRLRSPLWVSLAITAFLVVSTFLVPVVPVWVALVLLVTLAPLILLGRYSLYFLYDWVSNVTGIDEATFERKLDHLLETETLQRRDGPGRERDLLKE